MTETTFSADTPELRLLSQLAGLAPSRVAAAFSDPKHLYAHISIEELERFSAATVRLTALIDQLTAAANVALADMEKR